MPLKTIAIYSPGDMGSGVGGALGENGYDVITSLDNRSARTKELAQSSGIRDVGSIDNMVTRADLILCIMVPSQAVAAAERVAESMRSTGVTTFYADCNAVSPKTTRAIGDIITEAGGTYIDGGIIGGSPKRGQAPRFYVSGPNAWAMNELDGKGIAVRNMGGEIGHGSGIKMCYAALTKGTSTLHIALLAAAEAMGLSDQLRAEFQSSQPNALKQMDTGISSLPPNAHRWIGEMEEISATFEQVGVTPFFHQGAAEIYRLLGQTSFASETPETVDKGRPTSETIKAVVDLIDAGVATRD
ncbi:MAG: NAD(P)-dependent oxidoreductase [Chloroflexi bacterium]|nr:NAD(P)-dependent oxidoreductase [Chloroflexota bacterium]MCH9039119.1 NAD(P)-dependent oxidoreductase [Chloroflexota bacterium]